MSKAAFGVRSHSGWAALVVIGGPTAEPAILGRQRIELAGEGLPKQPYHEAEPLKLKEADALIRHCNAASRALAARAFRATMGALRRDGHEVVGCGLLLASGRALPALAEVLASHALIHAAEGEMFREALRLASKTCELRVTEVKERELWERCEAALRLPLPTLKRRLDDWGRSLGPPWRQDEKYAALVGWLALATRPASSSRNRPGPSSGERPAP
jgi:hypothetical protein